MTEDFVEAIKTAPDAGKLTALERALVSKMLEQIFHTLSQKTTEVPRARLEYYSEVLDFIGKRHSIDAEPADDSFVLESLIKDVKASKAQE